MNRSLLLYVLKRCHCTHLKAVHPHWVIEKLLEACPRIGQAPRKYRNNLI
ncbi:MAG: hypothetical protein ABW185_14565 [Sedimenticola sp.]